MGEAEDLVRRMYDALSEKSSVDELMARVEPLLAADVEWVNPPDALERGTRRGVEGWRTAIENLFAGLGPDVKLELGEMIERGDRVLALGQVWPGGTPSGADVSGPKVGGVWTIRDGQVARYEWFFDQDDARAAFDRDA